MLKLLYNDLTKRCKNISPFSLEDYIKNDGYKSLLRAVLTMDKKKIIEEVTNSGLTGRGGAGFPTGLKMKIVADIKDSEKYIICNADEGEPGTFKDRYLLENDPHSIIEGMAIIAYATDIKTGYIYIRGEYRKAIDIIKKAVDQARDKGYLGENILDQGFSFDIKIRSGAGSYICGEETALLESIEGKSARPIFKPPYPPESGLYNKPTIINNVETIANIPVIISKTSSEFKKTGTRKSTGTKLVCLSGNVVNKGVFEVPFGITLKDIIYEIGGGIPEGKQLKMVLSGGASGYCFGENLLNTKYTYEDMSKNGLTIGSGAIMVFDNSNCILDIIKNICEFFIDESCGKCTTCREGTQQLHAILEDYCYGNAKEDDFEIIDKISTAMSLGSLCGLGQTAPNAVTSSIKHFKEDYMNHINKNCTPSACTFK